MKEKFIIEVCRVSYGFASIEVEATSLEEANKLALDKAGDYEYSESSSEYSLAN